ncbi:IucA/IucC family siderophore biosynthesis protein [Streptomyces sp. NPDC048290]|uniref:IucA/IucC family protein n=1 Tax=Streptomyces sp. NPDC048290 TaxID=3155811 RepID=UPI00341F3033
MTLSDAVAHLTPQHWARANRLLIRKALAEFAHERLLTPEPDGTDTYTVRSDDGRTTYRFTAAKRALDHWQVEPDSITRHTPDGERPLSALDFILDVRTPLGLTDTVLPVYLEEISSTLAGLCFKLGKPQIPAARLASGSFQEIETGMTEGHPCFVANNGRLGFGVHEYLSYAPETASPVRLIWLAAHRSRATFTAGAGIAYDTFVRAELTPETVTRFHDTLLAQSLNPEDYYLLPVHPWQWWNKLTITFAAEIAEHRLICLGEGNDTYLPQQSIRTFFNTTSPHKHYVKTALSVINMGFMRGLSAAYMEATPAINDWLAQLIDNDQTLKSSGMSIIRERAAIGYRHLEYERATDRHSPYRKMLAALWRESPVPSLRPGETLATMASLLHQDEAGHSFTAALITRSGLPPRTWLRHYLDAYLTPLLHCFYAYDLVFMPHGENVILVLEDGVVRRVIHKDIAEEIAVMDPDAILPPAVERLRVDVPDDMKLLSIFTDIFDCFFRFLSAHLAAEGVLEEPDFWQTVAETIHEYQSSTPELTEKFTHYNLFTPTFPLSCLNRLQLQNNTQMLDLTNPTAALQLTGTLKNPLT